MAETAQRYAITFGEAAILHVGGESVGVEGERGFSVKELQQVQKDIERVGGRAELFMLSDTLPPELREGNEAATLVLRDGAVQLLEDAGAADALLAEQRQEVSYDTRYFDNRRQRMLQKRARYNVVFGDVGQEPSADFRQFTIKAFAEVPRLAALREALPRRLGDLARGLNAEGNLYHEAASGIGFHGDGERRIVVCLSLGASSTLRYHWRLPGSSEHTLRPIDLRLEHGDIYVMSEKATGFDWRLRSRLRVVHAAGSARYIGAGGSQEDLPKSSPPPSREGSPARKRRLKHPIGE